MTPNLTSSLDKALDDQISKLFENLVSNLIAPTYSQDKSTPIQRFEAGFKIALQAYEQATQVIEKEQPK
jgi:hypothetical protein